MRTLALFTGVIVCGLSVGAYAATEVIHQRGRVFSSETISVKKGSAVTFFNDDTVPHNIMDRSILLSKALKAVGDLSLEALLSTVMKVIGIKFGQFF